MKKLLFASLLLGLLLTVGGCPNNDAPKGSDSVSSELEKAQKEAGLDDPNAPVRQKNRTTKVPG